jgi:Predicted membrane protein
MSASMGTSDEIKSAGTLGLVGVILMLVGLIPYAEVLSIVGLVLVLIALNKLSKAYGNDAIWRNALYGFVMGMVGAVVLVIAVFVYIIPIFTMNALSPYGFGLSFLVFFVVLWIIAYVFVILEYRFFRDAYRELARSSGINDFNDAAKWYWYGALLFIIIVGAILILVGHVYALLGYNKLR